jgi:hypothetical protein
MNTHDTVLFPLSVVFEDGSIEQYQSVEDLEQNLEFFDSSKDKGCKVFDSLNRPVFLMLEFLSVKRLQLRDKDIT